MVRAWNLKQAMQWPLHKNHNLRNGLSKINSKTYHFYAIFPQKNRKFIKPKSVKIVGRGVINARKAKHEVWSFVKRRANKRWLWAALCRWTRQVVAYIIGDRSEKSCQLLWRAIPESYKQAHSDSDYSDFSDTYQSVP